MGLHQIFHPKLFEFEVLNDVKDGRTLVFLELLSEPKIYFPFNER